MIEAEQIMTESARCEPVATIGNTSWPSSILLVEDEAFVRHVTNEILQNAGYDVCVARDATEATRIFGDRAGEIDLLITDLALPGEPGHVLAARMKRGYPGLRILYITGYAEQMNRTEREGGEWMAKPFSSEALLERVREILQA